MALYWSTSRRAAGLETAAGVRCGSPPGWRRWPAAGRRAGRGTAARAALDIGDGDAQVAVLRQGQVDHALQRGIAGRRRARPGRAAAAALGWSAAWGQACGDRQRPGARSAGASVVQADRAAAASRTAAKGQRAHLSRPRWRRRGAGRFGAALAGLAAEQLLHQHEEHRHEEDRRGRSPASMPPITPVPMAFWLPEPAPLAMASGSTPRMKASEVIRIGRSADAHGLAASPRSGSCPRFCSVLGELDDQDRVLGRQADGGEQADLEVDVVGQAAQRGREHRAERRRAARPASPRAGSTSSRRAPRGSRKTTSSERA